MRTVGGRIWLIRIAMGQDDNWTSLVTRVVDQVGEGLGAVVDDRACSIRIDPKYRHLAVSAPDVPNPNAFIVPIA